VSDEPGRRSGIASLLMVPALVLWYPLAYLVGAGFQHALGLADDELLTEAGAWGVAAAVVMLAFIAVPQVVGIVLGVKARRLGEHRLGTAGVAVNAVVGGFLLATSVAQLLLA
jgi:hypothetical protein